MNRQRSEKPWQSLVDAQEDLLGEILGQRPVADHAQHVVVDRCLVGGEDQPEGVLVPALCLAQDFEIGLRKWH